MANRILPTLLCLMLAGCAERELPFRFDARDSLQITVALGRVGIEAKADRADQGRGEQYTISVPPAEFVRAQAIIQELGLPRRANYPYGGKLSEEMARTDIFLPQTAELAAARFDLALSAEAERILLAALPGVIEVFVSVSAEMSTLAAERQPKASVVLRYDSPSGKLPFDPVVVKDLVAQVVPGLSPERVLVEHRRVLLPTASLTIGIDSTGDGSVVNLSRLAPFAFKVSETEKALARRELAVSLMSFLLAGCVVGIYAGWVFGLRQGRRGKLSNEFQQRDR